MAKKQTMIVIAAGVVALMLIALAAFLIFDNKQQADQNMEVQNRLDSLALANEKLQLTNEYNQIQADFQAYEGQQVYLKNDSLVQQYDAAKNRVQQLLKELNAEKRSNSQNREKIKQLEAEITTLRSILKHYLEEIDRLGKENEGLRAENTQLSEQNQQLSTQVSDQAQRNQELSQVVQRAEKLNVTGVSLHAYNKKGKNEKNVTKARQLGVSFRISPNNTAKPGMKEVYVRIVSPEGALLRGNGSFNYEGRSLPYTAKRAVEYSNEELSTSIYWDVNTSLTPGDYTVEIFCDGNRLASRRFTLKK